MLPEQPSRTLLPPAIRRAAHQLLDSPLIFDDPVAVGLVPEAEAESIRADLSSHETMDSILLRSLFALRSRFTEDRLAAAAARSVRQYVMVGAGLETFPWRQPPFAKDMRIFMADHISSLVWTQTKFWERGLPKPANAFFVPLDIEQHQIAERLTEAGFDTHRPAFFSALGVTQYVERGATERLMKFVASLGAGSEIVLSYVPDEKELDETDRDFARHSAQRAGDLGEEWKTCFVSSELVMRLETTGFSRITHLTPADAQLIYFAGRHDKLRAPSWEQLVAAIV